MKQIIYLVFILAIPIISCTKGKDVEPIKIKDNYKESVKVMDQVRPKLYGTWKMQSVHVKPILSAKYEIGITKDTTLLDLASLNLTYIDYNSDAYRAHRNDVSGMLSFRCKSYPIGFEMMPTVEYLSRTSGPQIIALLQYRFPIGSHIIEAEENYLTNLTLIDDNYTIDISEDGNTMVWSGLNRAIEKIVFKKQR